MYSKVMMFVDENCLCHLNKSKCKISAGGVINFTLEVCESARGVIKVVTNYR